MSVTVYRSTDSSAPTLSGTAGSLIAVLDACLVNGYGSKAAAGWTKPHTATNRAVYRSPSGLQRYMNVNDTTTTYANIFGSEGATAVGTVTNAFPTTAQHAAGLYVAKSYSADSTVRPWVIIATQQAVYIWIDVQTLAIPTASQLPSLTFFGDIVSYKPSDGYSTMVIGGTSTAGGVNIGTLSSTFSAPTGVFIARSHTQTGTSLNVGLIADYKGANSSTLSGAGPTIPYAPEPIMSSAVIAPCWVTEASVVRGHIPGLWYATIGHYRLFPHGTQLVGTGALAGKTFESFLISNPNGASYVWLETSNTW